MKYQIEFNKPFLTGNEMTYAEEAVSSGKLSGNGQFTNKCQDLLALETGSQKVLLTTSCTDALEMSAILINIHEGDEVIMPSFTFVSTANAFILRGAKVIFCDSEPSNPNIDADGIEDLINERTKAIVVVHYAGVACDMDKIMQIAQRHDLYVIEDAAQAIDSNYKGRALGGIGDMGTFSFHETKNIQCGEGGALMINNEQFRNRAEIIWEKGTNRAAFFRGEIDKYGWVDLGSSFLPSELSAAFLFAQLENKQMIQARRKEIWTLYWDNLKELSDRGIISLPYTPEYATVNAHMFYLLCNSLDERIALIDHLKANGIRAVFHYIPLHSSSFYRDKHDGRSLPNCDRFSDCLIRLPLYYNLEDFEAEFVCSKVIEFYSQH